MQRRKFLLWGGTALGSLLLSQCARSEPLTESSPVKLSNTVSLSNRGARSRYTSQNGQLALDLTAQTSTLTLEGQTVPVWSYNGQVPGPRLEVKPGDRVQIRFHNQLPAPTNLHFHGLHIPPTGAADDVFRHIAPGETVTYAFEIPADHPATLAYYHPHLHGHVAQQIFAGLGGLIVVRGELDAVDAIAAADEQFLFLKDFDPAGAGATDTLTRPMHGMQMLGREGTLLTVNGEREPQLTLAAGGLLRLRVANASTSRFYHLRLENHPFYLIATDGGAIAQPQRLASLLLAPGERADVLIQGDRDPGTYRLVNQPYDRVAGHMGMGRGMRSRGQMGRGPRGMGNFTEGETTLATLTYQGSRSGGVIPESISPIDPLPEPDQIREFRLHHGRVPGQGMAFLINGQAFAMGDIQTQVKLGTTEDWLIHNTDMMDHPFHLHTNRFQLIEKNGEPVRDRVWKDTVLVAAGETVRIRIPFRDYPGRTVYHCHILDHEDLGMMGVIEMQA